MKENPFFQALCSVRSLPLPPVQTRLLGAIICLWPLGLALDHTSMNTRGLQRKLMLLACFQLPWGSLSDYTIQMVGHSWAGVTSIRALPQGACV